MASRMRTHVDIPAPMLMPCCAVQHDDGRRRHTRTAAHPAAASRGMWNATSPSSGSSTMRLVGLGVGLTRKKMDMWQLEGLPEPPEACGSIPSLLGGCATAS
jgi:hypothetical protein